MSVEEKEEKPEEEREGLTEDRPAEKRPWWKFWSSRELKYCPICEKIVRPAKYFSWLGVLLGGPLYVPYYYFLKKAQCPFCQNTELHARIDQL